MKKTMKSKLIVLSLIICSMLNVLFKLAKAGSSNKSQTLKYKVYWRPANKEQILIFY